MRKNIIMMYTLVFKCYTYNVYIMVYAGFPYRNGLQSYGRALQTWQLALLIKWFQSLWLRQKQCSIPHLTECFALLLCNKTEAVFRPNRTFCSSALQSSRIHFFIIITKFRIMIKIIGRYLFGNVLNCWFKILIYNTV